MTMTITEAPVTGYRLPKAGSRVWSGILTASLIAGMTALLLATSGGTASRCAGTPLTVADVTLPATVDAAPAPAS